jgi:hypothetical protein
MPFLQAAQRISISRSEQKGDNEKEGEYTKKVERHRLLTFA